MEAIKLCRLDTPIIFIEARINLSRFVVTGCAAKTSATVTFPSLNLISLFAFCFNIWLNGVASYFFFQAEDGIRDLYVTGVQTCALPICTGRSARAAGATRRSTSWRRGWRCAPASGSGACSARRSEERRVGKECRSRWSPCDLIKYLVERRRVVPQLGKLD